MRFLKTAVALSLAMPLALHTLPAGAQTPAAADGIVACPSQSELEQSINSAGSITPDDCTTLQLNALTSDGPALCLIDFGLDQGFIGRLRDAAFPTQWWVRCDALEAALQSTAQ